MNIKSTFFYTTVQTGIKVLAGLVMNKVIAVYVGPSGLALLGQFQNFATVVLGVANGSIQTGIVKYTAENKENEDKLRKILVNSLFMSTLCSLICSIFIITFANYLSKTLMYSLDYSYIFYVFSASILFYSLNLYVLSVLNGLGSIGLYIWINILISIVTLILTVILTISYRVHGALMAVILTQSAIFILTLFFTAVKFRFIYSLKYLAKEIDLSIIRNLLYYGAITFTSGAMASLAAILIRDLVQAKLSLNYAGIWEAGWRIVSYYNLIFVMPFSIYYLPKLSAAKNVLEIKKYLYEAFQLFIPLMILAIVVLYIFKHLIIKLLFTEQFEFLTEIILFMTIGELFRVLSMMYLNVLLSRNKIISTIISSIAYNVILVLFCYLGVSLIGFTGLKYAYCGAAIFWLVCNILLCKKTVFS